MVRILVCEALSLWTAELQRFFGRNDAVQVQWVASFEQLRSELSPSTPDRVISVIVVTSCDEAALDVIREVSRQAAVDGVVVLAAEEHGDWEWAARELGTDALLPDTTDKRNVVVAVENLVADIQPLQTGRTC